MCETIINRDPGPRMECHTHPERPTSTVTVTCPVFPVKTHSGSVVNLRLLHIQHHLHFSIYPTPSIPTYCPLGLISNDSVSLEDHILVRTRILRSYHF